MRTEQDTLGTRTLEDDVLYGINTLRASENFDLHHKKVNPHLLKAMITVKKAAAMTYRDLNLADFEKEDAIVQACDRLLSQLPMDAFPTEALQGGAGTSTNMNVNEVIANLALEQLGKPYGDYDTIHPLDDVNRGQSTNDVYPTALRIAAIGQLRRLSDECAALQTALQEKENEFQEIKKLGRTELMDAVPITLGDEFGAYAQAIARDRWRLYKVEERLRQMNLGGTAVGLGNGADRKYRFGVIERIRTLTGYGMAAAEYPMDLTQNNDVFVEVSGLCKALAVNLMKISNDFRLMNSGPYGGLREIRLAEMQQGSTIMAGKVNPVIPEMTMQCAMRVLANDTAITMAASHGEFELNAFTPLIADSLLESLELLTNATRIFREKAVKLLVANEEGCKAHLEAAAAFSASYVPILGYEEVAEIIHNHSPEEAKKLLEEKLAQKK